MGQFDFLKVGGGGFAVALPGHLPKVSTGKPFLPSSVGSAGAWIPYTGEPANVIVDKGHGVVQDLIGICPGFSELHLGCPDPSCVDSYRDKPRPIHEWVIHLNDTHRWQREQVASWMDGLDIDFSLVKKEATDADSTEDQEITFEWDGDGALLVPIGKDSLDLVAKYGGVAITSG